eukprot:313052-Rhodomonas_salina.3
MYGLGPRHTSHTIGKSVPLSSPSGAGAAFTIANEPLLELAEALDAVRPLPLRFAFRTRVAAAPGISRQLQVVCKL